MKIILILISLLLYFFAPMRYDYNFCLVCFLIGLVQILYIMKDDWKMFGFLNFNTIFFFSFVFVSFVFPVFVFPITTEFYGIMGLINTNVISKATALCLVALTCYCVYYQKAAKKYSKYAYNKLLVEDISTSVPNKIYLLSFSALLLQLVFNIATRGWEEITSQPYIISIYEVALPFVLISNCATLGKMNLRKFINKNIFVLLSTLCICMIHIILGDRGLVIICGMSILVTYWMYVGRISLVKLLPLLFVGVLLMYALRLTRGTDDSISSAGVSEFISVANQGISGTGFIFLFSDLIYICRELYFGFERTMQFGLFHPEKIFVIPFTPFPFLPTIISDLFIGIPFDKLHSGVQLNTFMATNFGESTSFGTHCVIDIFMSWGIIGVVFSFSLFGFLMGSISYKKENNLYYKMFFVIIMCLALYIPRDQIYAMIRPMAYAAFFVWILYKNKFILSR